ncbi:FAD-dependent oxidoreductase [Paraburkholderia dipogonis]|uniref:FAD-dependent oxidoreductase n=1 Tax=Paraburkholderia dipogonis TaxID=1211383 RepID=UPI0035F09B0D
MKRIVGDRRRLRRTVERRGRGAQTRTKLRVPADQVEVVVINGTPYHQHPGAELRTESGRETRVPLADVLGPIGVRLVEGEVSGIDSANGCITVQTQGLTQTLSYDRLVVAAGSQLVHPDIPGLDRARVRRRYLLRRNETRGALCAACRRLRTRRVRLQPWWSGPA